MKVNYEKYSKFTFDYLSSRLSYDPDTGIFRWKYLDDDDKDARIFNSKSAGNILESKEKSGYLVIDILYEKLYAHRVAYFLMTGSWPEGQMDHINGNRLDNRWENLRSVSRTINSQNRKIYENNKSGVCGVSKSKRNGKWRVEINNKTKKVYLGEFSDFFEAVCVRKSAELEFGYHENHGKIRG